MLGVILGALALAVGAAVFLFAWDAPMGPTWRLCVIGGLGGAGAGWLVQGSGVMIFWGVLLAIATAWFVFFVSVDCIKAWHCEKYGHLYPEGVIRPGELWDYQTPPPEPRVETKSRRQRRGSKPKPDKT